MFFLNIFSNIKHLLQFRDIGSAVNKAAMYVQHNYVNKRDQSLPQVVVRHKIVDVRMEKYGCFIVFISK